MLNGFRRALKTKSHVMADIMKYQAIVKELGEQFRVRVSFSFLDLVLT